jgi:hypothetical protein
MGITSANEPGSSVSIEPGYGRDDREIKARFPAEARDFSSNLCVQPAVGPTQPPVQRVAGVLSPGRDADHSPSHLVPSSRMSRSYTSSPASAFVVCSGKALDFYNRCKHVCVCVCVCVCARARACMCPRSNNMIDAFSVTQTTQRRMKA